MNYLEIVKLHFTNIVMIYKYLNYIITKFLRVELEAHLAIRIASLRTTSHRGYAVAKSKLYIDSVVNC